jgi:hypothetical protein
MRTRMLNPDRAGVRRRAKALLPERPSRPVTEYGSSQNNRTDLRKLTTHVVLVHRNSLEHRKRRPDLPRRRRFLPH